MNALLMQRAPRLNVEISKRGAIWNSLQELKEEISRELLDDGPLCQKQPVETLDEDVEERELEFHHRSQLEQRLLEITDAQDRLIDGSYGRCVECQEQINPMRLAADPAASLCLDCRRMADGEHTFPTM